MGAKLEAKVDCLSPKIYIFLLHFHIFTKLDTDSSNFLSSLIIYAISNKIPHKIWLVG